MKKSTKNIDLAGGNFPSRLRQLREDHHLSQSDLAEKTGLTYRTIHDIEKGKRSRVQEKTLMLIARALGMTLEELLDDAVATEPESTPSRRPLLVGLGVFVAMGLAVAAAAVWWFGLSHATWTIENRHLVAHHPTLGYHLWSVPHDTPIVSCEMAPWDSEHLIVAVDREAPGGGSVRCLDRRTGETLWDVKPDIDALVAAFGEDDVLAAGFSTHNHGFPDIDGDGVAEVLTRFTHGLYYPTAIVVTDRHGNRLSHYAAKGHVKEMLIVDMDGDGKDEIVVGGTNNAKAYQGATMFVLDDIHAHGASIDENCNPWSTEPDSARVRVVLPSFPPEIMEQMEAVRLSATNVQAFRNQKGETRLTCKVGGPDRDMQIVVHFDEHFDPIGAEPTDRFREVIRNQWPDSLKAGRGPDDALWLSEWLYSHRKFEAGHWPR